MEGLLKDNDDYQLILTGNDHSGGQSTPKKLVNSTTGGWREDQQNGAKAVQPSVQDVKTML